MTIADHMRILMRGWNDNEINFVIFLLLGIPIAVSLLGLAWWLWRQE